MPEQEHKAEVASVEATRQFLLAVTKLALQEGKSIPQAILIVAYPYMEFYSGQNTVKRALKWALENNQIAREDAIKVLGLLKRVDWIYEWFPEAIPEHVRLADMATAAKRTAKNQDGLFQYLRGHLPEARARKDQSYFWRAIILLVERRTISKEDARELLRNSGYSEIADKYIPAAEQKQDSGQASGEVDDWWRYD